MVLTIHVAAGGLAIVLGAVALLAKKGGLLHRRAGIVFVASMVVMGMTASLLGFFKSPTDPNVFAGFMTVYFVGTSLTTVRAGASWAPAFNTVALIIPLFLGIGGVLRGIEAFNSPRGMLNGVPFLMHFFLSTVLFLAAFGDVRVMRLDALRGPARLRRHLWRMCFALFIAAGSFFSIQERVAKVLPAPFTTWQMRLLPIVLIFTAMFYWLWRVRRRDRVPPAPSPA